jgi:rfaE bifunctional protein nucleotidyltransferase chain/domain
MNVNSNSFVLNKLKDLKNKNKKIGLCHGVFDVLHPGHIFYLQEAKKNCDILVVSLTADAFIQKGPGRPYFKIDKRKFALNSLSCVDFVLESHSETAEEIIKIVKPNFYIKGPDYKKNKDITGNLQKEIKAIKKVKGILVFTKGKIYSSSEYINSSFEIFTEKQKKIITDIKKKYSISDIRIILQKIKKITALVVGETIIDQYVFCEALGKSGKEPILAFRKQEDNAFVGGSAIVANNLSYFCKQVNLISYIGEKKEYLNFLNKIKPKNCNYNFIYKNKSPTIVKKRYVDKISSTKVFSTYDINDKTLDVSENIKLNNLIEKNIKKNNLTICLDYGHGFINAKTAKLLSGKSNYFSLNSQINAANIGYHPIDKYFFADCLVINETELRYELRDKYSNIEKLIKKLSQKRDFKIIIVTQGTDGATLFDKKNRTFYYCPAFHSIVKDKVGAGDTLLFIFSIVFYVSRCPVLSLFLSSLAAAENVKYYANSKILDDVFLIKILSHILK